ncbi:MAG: carbon storage regulator [Patescibacteria group bacterium]|nr:carbon storage regulator [Patescibacteria group bacterium]
MLVLSRYKEQRIMIDGGRIVITVLECTRDHVRLGIDAPKEVVVDREETHINKLRWGIKK